MLMRAGWRKLNYAKFLRNDFVANIAWMLIIGILGYAFSASFVLAKKYIKIAEIGLLVGIIVLVLFEKYVLGRRLGSSV